MAQVPTTTTTTNGRTLNGNNPRFRIPDDVGVEPEWDVPDMTEDITAEVEADWVGKIVDAMGLPCDAPCG